MAVTQKRYQVAQLVIVVFYTFFCVAVLGIEHPILRFLAAVTSALPVLWAIWTLALARLPPETLTERVREAVRYKSEGGAYRGIADELLALCREARELLRLAVDAEEGRMSRDAAFRRANEVERLMQERVERIGELANPRSGAG